MSSAQLKFVDKGVSTDIIDCSSAQNLHGVSESDVTETESPARALQAKLSHELQPAMRFEAQHPTLTALIVFVSACAGTWVFGALLYAQV